MVERAHLDQATASLQVEQPISSIKNSATQAASKALNVQVEANSATNVHQESSSLSLPFFRDVANSATELLAVVMQLMEETSRLEGVPLKTKQMSPYELKSWVDNIMTILKKAKMGVDVSLESLQELKGTLEESPVKPLFIDSILDLFKSTKT